VARLPIGVVMIWETPRSQRLYLRQAYHVLPAFNPRNGKVWFLIDGQQRVSAVHHVREGTELQNSRGKGIAFRRVVFSLEKEEDGQHVRYRRPIPGRYESLSDVLHPHWRSRLSHLGARQKDRVRRCRRQILDYPVHLMFVHGKLSDIRESFLRINTQGMKITTADAIFTRAEDLDLRDIRHEVRQQVDNSFGQIPDMPILFAMAAVRGGTEARGQALRKAIHRLERDARADPRCRKSLAKEWHRLAVCFGKAVDYLRQLFYVVSRDYLYSDYMVAVLALFFFYKGGGPGTAQKNQLRRWFWATAVGGRYSGRNFLRCLPDDVRFFKRLARNPKARFTANLYNSISNICLLTADENQSIGSRRPRSYLGEAWEGGTYFKRKMSRHAIPIADDSGVWETDLKRGFKRFLKERTDLICDELESAAGIRLFRRDL
jgi:hypothetical protein